MFENLKDSVIFDFKDSYDMTDKIEEELVQIEENSHNYATENFMKILENAKDQEEPLNISSIGENIFYHGIHFLKGRGWTEESIVEAVKSHFHMYDEKSEEPEEKVEESKTENK